MATAPVQLNLTVTGDTQTLANAKAKAGAQDFIKNNLSFINGLLGRSDEAGDMLTETDIDGWTNANLTSGLEALVKRYISEQVRGYRVDQKDKTEVVPVRQAPDEYDPIDIDL